MEAKQSSRVWAYGPGALAVLAVSIGVAAIVYGVNLLPFDLFNLFAWVFCPLGVYTVAYAFVARRDLVYFLVWGLVMLAIGLVSAAYTVVSPIVVLGILLIIIAVIGIAAYWRRKS